MTKFSYQLYSSRNFPPLSDTLTMLAECGYAEVEGYGALMSNEDNVRMLEEGLASTGLTMPTAHFNLDQVKGAPDAVMKTARRLGIRTIVVPYVAPEQRPVDAASWAAFGRNVAEAGKPFSDAGFTFAWHNHDFEFEKLDESVLPIDLILGAGDHMKLEFDLAWAAVAGIDPRTAIDTYADRIVAAHIKDIAPAGENTGEDGWADVGHGTMDWPDLYAALKALNVPSMIMEHDNPSDHHRFATRSLETVRALDGQLQTHRTTHP